jgi:hypothetical protein
MYWLLAVAVAVDVVRVLEFLQEMKLAVEAAAALLKRWAFQ